MSITPKNHHRGGYAVWGDSIITWGSTIATWGSPSFSMVNKAKNSISPANKTKQGLFLSTEALDFLMTEDNDYLVIGGKLKNLIKN